MRSQRPISRPELTKADQEELFGVTSAFESAPVGLCVLDLSFRYVTVNNRFAGLYGLEKGDFIGKTVEDVLPGPASQILLNLQEALATGGIVEREIALQNPNPESRDNLATEVIYLRTAQPLRNENGLVYGVCVALLDITARKRAESAFRELEEDLRYTVELTPHIPWTADASGELTFISNRWNTITGTSGAVHLKEWAEVLHSDDLPVTAETWSYSVATGKPYDAEYRIRSADGSWRWVRARAYPRLNQSGEVIRWYGTVEDIHDRKVIAVQLQEATEELARRAHEDHLTGLPNRRRFDEVLCRELDRARRTGTPTALIMIDIDHFKQYNDVGGHLLGDECLKVVATTISNSIRRPADLVARFGGEEFAVVLPETVLTGAVIIAERILAAIRQLVFDHKDQRVQRITLSAGVAVHFSEEQPGSILRERKLIEAADKALYRAKEGGRDCVGVAGDWHELAAR